jgi:DNA repair protein SbcC/Rad50
VYEVNDVPKTQKEYQAVVEEICPESVYKLLSSPTYFPTKLKWQSQREMLFKLTGQVSDQEVAEGNEKFEALLKKLNGKSFDDYKAQIAAKKKKIKNEIDLIPARYNEVERNLPEKQDWKLIEDELSVMEKEYEELDGQISDKTKLQDKVAQERAAIQKEIYELDSKLEEIRRNHQSKLNAQKHEAQEKVFELERKIKTRNKQKAELQVEIKELDEELKTKEAKIKELREEWHKENAKTITFTETGDEFLCPTCKRRYDQVDVQKKQEELTRIFNITKTEALKSITEKGKKISGQTKELAKDIEDKSKLVDQYDTDLEKWRKEVDKLKGSEDTPSALPPAEEREDYKELQAKMQELSLKLSSPVETVDVEKLKERKKNLTPKIDELKGQLRDRETIAKGKERMAQLDKQQKELAQELAGYERDEFAMQEFTAARIRKVEAQVNSMFSVTKFKLFDQQINGQVVETCQATHDGVPYADLNTAMKVNVGLDIINTISKHFGISVPIFIDNRESVNDLVSVDAQLVNLIVTKDKKLIVEKSAAAA